MKQHSWLIITVFIACVLCISGCSGNFESKSKGLTLTGNPTTGYTWLYEIDNPEIVEINEAVMYLGKEGMSGAPSLYTYTFTSLEEGKADVYFRYQRPWESSEPENNVKFRINVNKKGKIRIRKI